MKIVKIKEWDKMVEIGEVEDDAIYFDTEQEPFVVEMENMMPENRIIVVEFDNEHYNWSVGNITWVINSWMIDEYLNPEYYPEYLI